MEKPIRDLYLELKEQYKPYSAKVIKLNLFKSKGYSPGDTLELIIDEGSGLSKNEKFGVIQIGGVYRMKYRGMMNSASDTFLGNDNHKTSNVLDLANTLSILKADEVNHHNRLMFISTLTYEWGDVLGTFRYISKKFKDKLH